MAIEVGIKSTVKFNCGCGITKESSSASTIAAAMQHVETTGHTVDIVGRIKPAVAKAKVYIPPFKSLRKEPDTQ